VGTEHARWLEEDISGPGVAMLRSLFEGFDPGANLNPGKIVERTHEREAADPGYDQSVPSADDGSGATSRVS
jgi:hypothetical protein